MCNFITKLQYKNYETGEYSEEKTRNIEETLILIENFPWEEQRYLIDIKITGPSVTIQNDEGAYLKLGLFFNNKFCVYLLDELNHFYEAHFSTLKEACEVVTAFLNNQLLYINFEKHYFSFNQKHYFETKMFIYQVGWQQASAIFTMALISFFFLNVCYIAFKPNDSQLYNDSPFLLNCYFRLFHSFLFFVLVI